jgi:hypothetical protein
MKRSLKPPSEITSEDAQNEQQVIKQKADELQEEILVTAADVLVDEYRIYTEKEKKELVDRLTTGRGLGEGNLSQDEFRILRDTLRLRLVPVYRQQEDVVDIGKQTASSQLIRPTRWQLEIEQRLVYVLALLPRERSMLLVSPKFFEMWLAFEKRLGEMSRTGQDVLISQAAILDARLTIAEQRYQQKPVPRESLIHLFARLSVDALEYAYRPVAALEKVLKKSSVPGPLEMKPEPKGK